MSKVCWHRQIDAWNRLGEVYGRMMESRAGEDHQPRVSSEERERLETAANTALEMFALFTGQTEEAVRSELDAQYEVWGQRA